MSLLSKPTSSLELAGKLLVLSGILHVVAFVITGMTVPPMAAFGVVYALLGLGILRGWKIVTYIAFIFTLIGCVAAYINLPPSGLLMWFILLFMAMNVVILIALFLHLWKGR